MCLHLAVRSCVCQGGASGAGHINLMTRKEEIGGLGGGEGWWAGGNPQGGQAQDIIKSK